ncbi:hypothetical protein FIBSPDRAFT_927566 [Athelia psychrophila]|uniref:Nephrocystin 3-like N-terminal domain-containing protein n=1 Tax=Athelia psychrophila TaxID=1759441 RepID=A0A166RMG3_9AGAM|nr:hypothetical protein FIBSPDRAFT_927566 [Fibularhizoctonia sp. CBS 109695]
MRPSVKPKTSRFANPNHYIVLYIDGKPVPTAGYKMLTPAPQWPSFRFNISSAVKIVIFRKRLQRKDAVVAQYEGEGRDFLDRDKKYVLTDERGSQIDLRLSININLMSESPAEFINSVNDNVSRLQSFGPSETEQALGGLGLQLFQILQQIVPVIDESGDAHPVLKMIWTILSSAYKAVKNEMNHIPAVCDLAKSLQEILGVATIVPALARIQDTDDVITEIRRAALEGALLIAEYGGTALLADQLSDISDRITQCEKRCTDLGRKFRARGIHDVQMEENIEKWMDAPDTSINFNAARKKHQPGTGCWFLDGSAFTRWRDHPDILLWLQGGPGCGKTLLCLCAHLDSRGYFSASTIMEIIDFCNWKASTGYAYFFFDGRSAEAALLVHDNLLADRCDGIPMALAEMYLKCDMGSRQPPIEMLETTVVDILDTFNNVYIIIDSLDECSERKEVIQWIQSIASRASGKLHMAVSSRPVPEIVQGLRVLSQLEEICISSHQNKSDIHSYLNARLSQADANEWEAQKDEIRETLESGADGMFHWVALQADRLIKSASPRELENHLNSLPRDLNETYSRILSESSDPGNLKKLLQWLAYSRRAMTVGEIAEVAVIDFGDDGLGLPYYEAGRKFKDFNYVLSLGLLTEVEVYNRQTAGDRSLSPKLTSELAR